MGSYDYGKREVVEWIRQHFLPDAVILDVGACDGKWRRLLPEYTMDAVEIFEPYARKLTGYRNVFITDITALNYDWYDLIIFGDIVEHMTPKRAKAMLEYAKPRCADMIIAVPWEYKQGIVDGNKWQAHIQDDLTPELFAKRFPGFQVLHDPGNGYCYYHKGTP